MITGPEASMLGAAFFDTALMNNDDVIVARDADSNPAWVPYVAYTELLAEMEDIVGGLQAQLERERRAYMGSICYRLRVWWYSL